MHFYDLKIYQYGDSYKVIYFPHNINEYVDGEHLYLSSRFTRENEMIGNRFACNVSRTRNTVLGLGMCNEWEYFVTATLDPQKYDRYNLPTWRKDFAQWIRNQRKAHGHDFKYVFIPERHQSGAWHMHGLVSGISWDSLKRFDPAIHPWDLVAGGYRYHEGMLKRFGFNSFARVQNQAAVSRYILKYIAKGIGEMDLDNGVHLFYACQGLNRPEVIKEGQSTCFLTDIDYENDFMASKWITAGELERISEYIY